MDDDMTSTLVIHGPEICADKAKKIIGTEFRRWPLEYCDTSMSRQAGDEASAVLVEIRLKTLVPPVEQVRTLSGEHPVLTFTLEFGRPSCEYRARLAYSEGKISAWAAKAKKTSHASPGDQAPAVSDGGQESEVPQPEMLRRLAEHFLKAAYGGIYSSIFEGVGLKPKDRCEILDQFAVCAEIRGLLPSEEKANLDGLEIECKAHE